MNNQPIILVTRLVAEHTGLQTAQLVSEGRERRRVQARWLAFWLCSDVLGIPAKEIGRRFRRDHSTVLYGVKQARKSFGNPVKAKEANDLAERVREACGVREAFAVLRSVPTRVTFSMSYPRYVDCGVSRETVPA